MDSQKQAHHEYQNRYPLLHFPIASPVTATKQNPLSNDHRFSYRDLPSRHRSRSPLHSRHKYRRRSISPLSSRDLKSVLSRNSKSSSRKNKATHRNNDTRSKPREYRGRNRHHSTRSRSRSEGLNIAKNKHTRVCSMTRERTSCSSHLSPHLISSPPSTTSNQLVVAFHFVSKSKDSSSRQHATLTELSSSSLCNQTFSSTVDKKDYSSPSTTPHRNGKKGHHSSLNLSSKQYRGRSPSPSRGRRRARHHGGYQRSSSPPRGASRLSERVYKDPSKSTSFRASLHKILSSNNSEILNNQFIYLFPTHHHTNQHQGVSRSQLAVTQPTNIRLEQIKQKKNTYLNKEDQELRPSEGVLDVAESRLTVVSKPFSPGNTPATRGVLQSDYYHPNDPTSHGLHGPFEPGDTPAGRGVQESDRWRPRDVKGGEQRESLSFEPFSLAKDVPEFPTPGMSIRMSLEDDACSCKHFPSLYLLNSLGAGAIEAVF